MSAITEKYNSGQIFEPGECIGIRQYITYELKAGEVPMPADTSLYIILVIDGHGEYAGIRVSEGEAVAVGLNKKPVVGFSQNMTLYILEIDFLLFFHLTGVLPAECSHVFKLDCSNPFSELCRILKEISQTMWRGLTDKYLAACLEKGNRKIPYHLERVNFVSRIMKNNRNIELHELTRKVGLSCRQLERDFKSALGMTPLEFRRVIRFQTALHFLKSFSQVETASLVGYCDQAHMLKDFRQMSPWTPAKSTPHLSGILPLQEIR